jgi:hypothetical protein
LNLSQEKCSNHASLPEAYDKPCAHKPWRKMHLSIDPEMNMHGIEITDYEASDIEMADVLLIPEEESQPIDIDKVIADGFVREGTSNLLI